NQNLDHGVTAVPYTKGGSILGGNTGSVLSENQHIRHADGIEGALARPQNVAAYGTPDASDLAAAYAFGLAENHGFMDGKKRTAWIAARLFLADNGHRLRFQPVDAIQLMEGVAGGVIGEDELARWFREHLLF
ncbi:type II toxin-antitoxin system death-on-curing family toxin, partial [Martelella sp.]|uniref:type II toxin-antitoxin system death-on-curing family toxin n=1 Tax=Martelella sp. TaxID=1969699 RepID=UPI0025BA6B8B